MKGEGGGSIGPWQTVTKTLGEGGQDLPVTLRKNIKFLQLSHRNYNVSPIYSFKIASKCTNVITVVSSCT